MAKRPLYKPEATYEPAPEQGLGSRRRARGRMPGGGANPIDSHVGNRIRVRRTLLGLSQGKLGEALGLTFQQIQKYERGANRVGASRLYDLARVLGVSVGYFFDAMPDAVAAAGPAAMRAATADPVLPDVADDDESRRETLQLVRTIERLSAADLAAIKAMIAGLTK